jgi:hypothetical protein
MLVIKDTVVIITCIVVVLWILVSHHQAQQALLWWNNRQWMRMYQEGEIIRNGLLQESFIIRRYLELSSVNSSESQHQQDQYYLTTIEKFHRLLKELSDYLSPAYIDDSLSLAIGYLLESWKSHTPALNLKLELPTKWHQESHQLSRIILVTLEELLQINLSNISNSVSIFVSLKSQGHMAELMVQLTYSHEPKFTSCSKSLELNYLRRTFKFLTDGECLHYQKDNTQTWYFRWRCSQGTTAKQRNHL